MIEQYFDIGKSSSRLTPLRVHSEEALYGHLILSMIGSDDQRLYPKENG